jgi:hypothetical protein
VKKIKLNLTEDKKDFINHMGYKNIDNKYTFFYDETNNIRKLFLKEDGKVNIQVRELHQNFVLGGVFYEKATSLKFTDFESLKKDLYLDKKFIEENKEIKFRHIAKGNFLQCLKSTKLKIFLEWILSNDLYIHYSTLDILYWSIVDIIESSVEHYQYFQYEDLNYFKVLLYEISKVDLESFLNILFKYDYPNIKNKKNKKFLNEIIKYIDKHKKYVIDSEKITNNVEIFTLIDILRSAKNKELVFIEDNVSLELIDEFGIFYQRPIGLFINSKHIFDIEEQVFNHFSQFEFCDGETKLENYVFKDSQENWLIQISDVTVGFLGKYMSYINELKFSEINKVKDSLNSLQKDNIKLLFKLLTQSELKSKAFVHHIAPLTAIYKGSLLAQEFKE